MLVVSRKVGERILSGDKITVTVVKVGNGGVRIGIDAPTEMAVIREELAQKLREADRERIVRAESQDAEAGRPPAVEADQS